MDSFPPVLTKKDNYILWQGGFFGNKLRSWRSVDEWRASKFSGMVSIRTLVAGGGPCFYDVDDDKVEGIIAGLGLPSDQVMINESAPNDAVLLQGEYRNDACIDGSYDVFLHSWIQLKMRDALRKSSSTVTGLQARLLVQGLMTPSSFADWQVLIDRYPGHVLEVSIYNRCFGDTPQRNALVWEVRRF